VHTELNNEDQIITINLFFKDEKPLVVHEVGIDIYTMIHERQNQQVV